MGSENTSGCGLFTLYCSCGRWPGTLGRTANHSMVIAQLVIGDKKLGTHNFIVPIRGEDHLPLPGVRYNSLFLSHPVRESALFVVKSEEAVLYCSRVLFASLITGGRLLAH